MLEKQQQLAILLGEPYDSFEELYKEIVSLYEEGLVFEIYYKNTPHNNEKTLKNIFDCCWTNLNYKGIIPGNIGWNYFPEESSILWYNKKNNLKYTSSIKKYDFQSYNHNENIFIKKNNYHLSFVKIAIKFKKEENKPDFLYEDCIKSIKYILEKILANILENYQKLDKKQQIKQKIYWKMELESWNSIATKLGVNANWISLDKNIKEIKNLNILDNLIFKWHT